jgi:hypothetical protein
VLVTERVKNMTISDCENVTWAEAGTALDFDLPVASYPGIGGHDDEWCERVDRIQFILMPSTSRTGKVVKVALRAERQSR